MKKRKIICSLLLAAAVFITSAPYVFAETDAADPLSASEVSTSIESLVQDAADVSAHTPADAEKTKQRIEETKAAYYSLPEKDQNLLAESKTALDNAEIAVDSYLTPPASQNGLPNSFRYLNGQPVDEALQNVESEQSAVEAESEQSAVEAKNKQSRAANESENTEAASGSGAKIVTLSKSAKKSAGITLLGSETTSRGIDVSSWQEKINWQAVKNAGIQFAIIRCGFGTNIAKHDDYQFAYNVQQCESLGIPYGVYFYSYAANTSAAQDEANHALRLLKAYCHNVVLPVYLDMEDNSQRSAGASAILNTAEIFCSAMKANGYQAGIYASTNWWNNELEPLAFDSNYHHWIAQWSSSEPTSADCELWQYSSKGSVSGISGNVDMDTWYGAFPNADDPSDDVPEITEPSVVYSSYVQGSGWTNEHANGHISGTTGKALRMEDLKVSVKNVDNLGITYSAYVPSEKAWITVSDGKALGTTGRQMEAVKMSLTGDAAQDYDIYYRMHVQNLGWMKWAKNGEESGSNGYDYRIEAVEILLQKKGAAAPSDTDITAATAAFQKNPYEIRYKAHVQNIGWQSEVMDGATAGTTGKALRMEAAMIASPVADLEYQTHIQNIGWEKNWTKEGSVSGTTGKALRMEAIRIRLTGNSAKKYDIYYRVHVQNIGWTDWAKNGVFCGSEGKSLRMEAMEVVLVSKGDKAPGSTNASKIFYKK